MSYGNALWWCVKYLTKSSHLKKNQGTSIYFSKCVIFQIALYEEQEFFLTCNIVFQSKADI